MNRAMKFRVWDRKCLSMHLVQELHLNTGSVLVKGLKLRDCDFRLGFNEYDLMQFVNSKDKNGVDVYDGDILKAPSGKLFVVRFNEEELRWSMHDEYNWFNMNMPLLEVVGNIFENPDLIQKRQ